MAGRGKGKKPAAPKRKANGYKMPAPIPVGEVINDAIMKKKWRIGPSIGVGGFGEIYSACDHENSAKGASYPFVIKIEPHENGPLFVEKHFYVRNANKDEIAKYMREKKLTSFGMPTYMGNGSHEYKGEKYRYLVLERYGKDLWSLFKDMGRSFPTPTVFQLGLQMLDVLEYIHNRGYVHADIKGANILLGLKKGTENQAYLVDFGLATRVNDKEFKPDPKCAHNGTIEYTSRDAHLGVATMRGDLEILGYNMLQWIVGELPWEKSLKQPKTVQSQKEAFLKSVRTNINKQYDNVPEALIKFFEYIDTLKPKEVPDYTKCRQFFESYLKSEGKTKTSKLEFTVSKTQKTKAANVGRSDSDTGVKDKIPRRGKLKKTVDIESDQDSVDSDLDKNKTNGDVVKGRINGRNGIRSKTKNQKVIEESDVDLSDSGDSDVEYTPSKRKNLGSNDSESNSDKQHIQNVKRRGRKPKVVIDDECENEEPEPIKKNNKRKSLEPAVLVKVKKTKMAPRATPPVKKNHANMATQTSIEKKRSPRQVKFDSPICEIIGENRLKPKDVSNSSGDIFDDSFTIEDKKVKKTKRKLISDVELTVKRVVKKKVVAAQAKGK